MTYSIDNSNMPDGCSDLDIPTDKELDLHQQEQIDFINVAVDNYKQLIAELEMIQPTGIKEDISNIIDEIAYQGCDAIDYIEG
jgi:hypothetical protein